MRRRALESIIESEARSCEALCRDPRVTCVMHPRDRRSKRVALLTGRVTHGRCETHLVSGPRRPADHAPPVLLSLLCVVMKFFIDDLPVSAYTPAEMVC